MEYSQFEINEYFNEEDKRRLSRMLMQSRAQSGLSQEKVALEMGIAKKTVQNWEKGISAPSLPQAIEWFRIMKIPAMPYFLQFMFPDIEGINGKDDDEKIRKEFINLVETLPMDGIRQLMYLFYGDHGSSPRGVMNLVTAHLQCPLRDRYSHASLILASYKLNENKNQTARPDHVHPDLEVLEGAIEKARQALIADQGSYNLLSDRKTIEDE